MEDVSVKELLPQLMMSLTRLQDASSHASKEENFIAEALPVLYSVNCNQRLRYSPEINLNGRFRRISEFYE